ncbi:DNA-binding response regulator [Clostridium botulinum]|uniref:CD3324 family protein n=1 Tax=Clostridium TaxID=1485 RepID=UPI001A912D0D|nr:MULTISPECIES: CD3324 family protein [Clostridium]EKO1913921.1 DNA-binding response regulator [Clostridium botulinum]EKO1914597.1 DNA-binding response regulator [Clostridium botulinum]EKO2043976.1 DNA-binding response regulator [Clostridium botulinum]EKO2044677.1 DNA-binding response regulator [Clostridium botulinum]MBO0524603.1 DNA-binding response regulator [Clostridium botulinum]
MGYKQANKIFPTDLLNEIQNYVDGQYVYIPRKDDNQRMWGEVNRSKEIISKRNIEIFKKYNNGISVKELASMYYLSPETIYKIINKIKFSL